MKFFYNLGTRAQVDLRSCGMLMAFDLLWCNNFKQLQKTWSFGTVLER